MTRTAAVGLLAVALAGCDRWESTVVVDDATTPSWSPDGGTVAFSTFAALTPGDTNGLSDVYVRDLATGTTTLLSGTPDGTQAGDRESYDPRFSPDGTTVAFTSMAGNLGPADGNGLADVYTRPVAGGKARLVSANSAGTSGGDGQSWVEAFTADGSLVIGSQAGDLGPADSNGVADIYLVRARGGRPRLVSTNAAGTGAGNDESWAPAFSADGTRVAFASRASDLAGPDGDGTIDVFLRDLARGTTTLVSVDVPGSRGRSWSPAISSDGMRVAFASEVADPGQTTTREDVFVRDVRGGITSLVSVHVGPGAAGASSSFRPGFSPDGTKIAFLSTAGDLGPSDPVTADYDLDVYSRDLTTGTTSLVSVNAAGTDGSNGVSDAFTWSPDGTRIAFVSDGNDLGPADTNRCPVRPGIDFPCADVYVRHLPTGTTSLASIAAGQSLAHVDVNGMAFLPGDSTRIGFWGLDWSGGGDAVYLATLVPPPREGASPAA